ncbi:DHH family phosphoesterase [Virgibacillus pantothenticus]|uniref:DHH family phosphoesterase n=1 Tax=Virgibacillus pantothenticus TaxID=1473 RepID=UPI000987B92D|nr:DHHA1 domain-containing protein [Virgibacillus pantothenticus]
MTKKYKLFTHTDLDGIGCAIVAKDILGNVDVEYLDYHNVDKRITDFITNENPSGYEAIYITDISVNRETAALIKKSNADWTLLDHHATATWLNQFDWAKVVTENEYGKESGTSLLFNELGGDNILGEFVEKVRRYDTWEWHDIYSDHKAKELNDLLFIVGRDRFVERFNRNLDLEFTEAEQLLLDLEREKINRIIDEKNKQIRTGVVKVSGVMYEMGVIFSEGYTSELGNVLAKYNPSLDLIAIINPSRSVSLRTIKDDVNVGEIAKEFGGGGHPKAAGFRLDDSIVDSFVHDVFNKERD